MCGERKCCKPETFYISAKTIIVPRLQKRMLAISLFTQNVTVKEGSVPHSSYHFEVAQRLYRLTDFQLVPWAAYLVLHIGRKQCQCVYKVYISVIELFLRQAMQFKCLSWNDNKYVVIKLDWLIMKSMTKSIKFYQYFELRKSDLYGTGLETISKPTVNMCVLYYSFEYRYRYLWNYE